jgi:hypothetical protein
LGLRVYDIEEKEQGGRRENGIEEKKQEVREV